MEIHGSISSFALNSTPSGFAQKPETDNGLTKEEQEKVSSLKARDQEVRQHEQAHINAAGGLVNGGPNYEYETGPDGRQYAVEGSVEIDTSKENDPEKTLKKARKIQAAALAPAEPSNEDRAVAAEARRMEMEARKEIAKNKQNENQLYNRSGMDENLAGLQATLSLII